MYREYKNLDLQEIHKEELVEMDKLQVFSKSIEKNKANEKYIFYEGPPSANGLPGIHHVMGRTIKDIFCRFKSLKGYHVERKAGWDTHGLPVELSVEKLLSITKEDIGEKISVKEYNEECRKNVLKYKKDWELLTKEMGYWVDMENPYITYENKYIESVWWLLKEFYKKDLLYKGFTIQPFSPKAGTGLSTHELNQPGCYRMVKDTSVTAQFKIVKNDLSDFLFENNEDIFYYLTLYNENYPMPALPKNCEEGVLKGIYKFKSSKKAQVRLIGSGPIMQQVLKAENILNEMGIKCEVWSATSFGGLRRDAIECERWNALNPLKKAKIPYISKIMADKEMTTVAATDHMRAVPDMIRSWIPGRYTTLGTDGFGRSDTRENLRKFFEINDQYIAAAAISSLLKENKISKDVAKTALSKLDVNPDAPEPSRN